MTTATTLSNAETVAGTAATVTNQQHEAEAAPQFYEDPGTIYSFLNGGSVATPEARLREATYAPAPLTPSLPASTVLDPETAPPPPETTASNGRVMTKARRIRLAAVALQSAQILQDAGSPAAALIHSQHVQQLRDEEALLKHSLARLRAERELAKVRHDCETELCTFREGLQGREALFGWRHQAATTSADADGEYVRTVIDITPAVGDSVEDGATASCEALEDAPVDHEGVLQAAVSPVLLLGMPATSDAAAAVAESQHKRSGKGRPPKKKAIAMVAAGGSSPQKKVRPAAKRPNAAAATATKMPATKLKKAAPQPKSRAKLNATSTRAATPPRQRTTPSRSNKRQQSQQRPKPPKTAPRSRTAKMPASTKAKAALRKSKLR